jgi:nucleoside-triphosphatase THEP1
MSEDVITDETTEVAPEQEEVTQLEKFQALEQQCYIMYLQLHALTKLLTDKEVLTQDEISEEMEEMNKNLVNMVTEILEEEKKAKV